MSNASAEVAADFRDALQDLKINSRPEISNLTIIAKENTEHAQAISHELENHIRTTRPEWKLPALYVLDSIVKNVGTPYTVFLGRNLYRTFMDAYMVMDPANRRAMDGLLKTWKQPVPESMDTNPVFSPEVTRDIENALIKIRTVTVQQQAMAQRTPHGLPPRPASNPMASGAWRNTPTPPQGGPRHAAPNDPRVRHNFPTPNNYGQLPVATPPSQVPTPQPPVTSIDLESLKADLAKLIASTRGAWEATPTDLALAQKLKALMDLQTVLNTQTIPPQQLQAIRTQIQALSPPPPPVQTYVPPIATTPQPFIPSPQQAAPPSLPPASGGFNLAQLLAQARPPVAQTPTPTQPTLSLADLLRRVSSPGQMSSTPVAAAPFPPPPHFPPVPQPVATPTPAPAPTLTPTTNLAQLLAQMTKSGSAPPPQVPQLPQLPTQPPAGSSAPGATDWLLNALKGVPQMATTGVLPQSTPTASTPMTRQASGMTAVPNSVELTTASMKQPRFHLIARLYGAKPNICATCGRRFENSAEGKEKKARHMDWHFRVKDPDATKRGIHRSWYISEKEWIEYREVDESAPDTANSAKAAAVTLKKDPKEQYVHVPADAARDAPCPICLEKFDSNLKWHTDANDFVWMDAVNVNGKVYHATCWDEYSKGAGIPAPSTPDPVLGKRKADIGTPVSGKKVRAY
ncbi:uncharacterized protein EI97DRAFT_451838 [Westerdykella ornata]|uniref:CID domain-containing protein n=1 Tax=Westerdykella ornata TaxID=318751 RepID=A0A6A6JDH1_WESOR|nr:uncharacterized protein EI97DRAFT_451838 [Westerdykella ornata]KAF2274284.1 hypothetical protein EI97DRAFT_451838 [Westerdykella ornata]